MPVFSSNGIDLDLHVEKSLVIIDLYSEKTVNAVPVGLKHETR